MSESSAAMSPSDRRRRITLTARARALARPRKTAHTVASVASIVCEVGDGLYALPLASTKRVVPFERAAPVPTGNAALLGVIGLSGAFYHVYDLGALIGSGAGGGAGHVILLKGEARGIAIRTDRVLGVADLVELAPDAASRMRAIHPAVTAFVRSTSAELFKGRVISLLDPERLTSDPRSQHAEGNQSVDK
jgi:chemotaxis signal transduction protein